jgi:hypothetical protein
MGSSINLIFLGTAYCQWQYERGCALAFKPQNTKVFEDLKIEVQRQKSKFIELP